MPRCHPALRALLLVLSLLFFALPARAQQVTLHQERAGLSTARTLDCPERLNAGDLFTYDGNIRNNGNSAAQGVFLEAITTQELNLDSLRTSAGTWTQPDALTARLDIGTLAPGASVRFEIDLLGAAAGEGMFTLTLGQNGGQAQTDACTIVVFSVVSVDGDIVIGEDDTLEINPFTELRLIGDGSTLTLNPGASLEGEGLLTFAGATHTIELVGQHELLETRTATFQNFRVEENTVVTITDDDGALPSALFVTNRLDMNGRLDIEDNHLWITGPTNQGFMGGVHLEEGAAIEGAGYLIVAIDPIVLDGPPNTRQSAYRITGAGVLNVALDKTTEAGVLIEATEVGNGGVSFSRAGALFFTGATAFNGSFRNEGAARTEFDALRTITSNVEVTGPGSEVFPGDGACGSGDENGVFFFAPVTIEGDLTLEDTDDPSTTCQVEGAFFLADRLPPRSTRTSTIEGDFTATGAAGLFLDFDDPPLSFHNLAFEGDLTIGDAIVFQLNAPADDFSSGKRKAPCPGPIQGNKVVFSGGLDQLLDYNGTLTIASVEIDKDLNTNAVEIAATSGVFEIGTSLELTRGTFITNGLLDMGTSAAPEDRATFVLNREDTGAGFLEAGNADPAYVSNDDDDLPGILRYLGNATSEAGDEMPDAPLPYFEVCLTNPGATLTLNDPLAVTRRLDVLGGRLNVGNNNFFLFDGTAPDAGVHVATDAAVLGTSSLVVAIEPAALGGRPNTRADAYPVTGEGVINLALNKTTDAGVLFALPEAGNGGLSFNRAGALFFTETTTLNGSFRNEGAARTTFDALQTITGDLDVAGPGGEIFPGDGLCGNGDESGAFFFAPVTVEGDLVLDNSDDPATTCQVEGAFFQADALPPGGTVYSTVEGTFAANGATGLFLDFDNPPFAFHNLAFEGDFSFGAAPVFQLNAPANAFPVGNLDAPYTNEALGSKVRFSGAAAQTLRSNAPFALPSVQVQKATGADIEIEETSAPFLIDTSLEILSGNFITNGLLDAGGTATVVINRGDTGDGELRAGAAALPYLSEADGDLPRKVTYTGSASHFTGDELPETFLPILEVFMRDENTIITLGKDFTVGLSTQVGGQLIITRGILDVGSSILRLANRLSAEIGDGALSVPEQIGARGRLEFPTDWIPNPPPDGFGRAFVPGADGIDLLYFGTTDRTVGVEWPAAVTSVTDRREDPDVIRNVRIDPDANRGGSKAASAAPITISLRPDDDVYRINGTLFVADGSTLDPNGALLEVGATTLLQVIHNAPDAGPLDFSVNDEETLDGLAFQAASGYLAFPAGETALLVTNADGTPLAEGNVTLDADESFAVFLHGLVDDAPDFGGLVVQTRRVASDPAQVEFFIVQGAPDAPPLDFHLLPSTPSPPVRLLADDLAFNDPTPYLSVGASPQLIEVTSADGGTSLGLWRFDLSDRAGQALVLLGSGLVADGSFELIAFDADGALLRPTVVTDVADAPALPSAFALHGNYPNPFNPTTTLRFDLSEPATVRVEVFDMMGRQVLALPEAPFGIGAGHALPVEASALASGVYFYRLIARTPAQTLTATGRMLLMK